MFCNCSVNSNCYDYCHCTMRSNSEIYKTLGSTNTLWFLRNNEINDQPFKLWKLGHHHKKWPHDIVSEAVWEMRSSDWGLPSRKQDVGFTGEDGYKCFHEKFHYWKIRQDPWDRLFFRLMEMPGLLSVVIVFNLGVRNTQPLRSFQKPKMSLSCCQLIVVSLSSFSPAP